MELNSEFGCITFQPKTLRASHLRQFIGELPVRDGVSLPNLNPELPYRLVE
jgi:hypothetical protein